MEERRLMIDVCAKYLVLFAFTLFIGLYLYATLKIGKVLDLPDWIVVIFTLIFQYFFRKSPTKNNKGGE